MLMEQRIDDFIELFEGYEELNFGSITKGIVKDALMAWVKNPRQNGVDTIIRHKWPEEKPKHSHMYLVHIKNRYYSDFIVAIWKDRLTKNECDGPFGDMHKVTDFGFFQDDSDGYLMSRDDVDCWWELPGVKE